MWFCHAKVMSVEDLLLAYLDRPRLSYKGVPVGAFGLPRFEGIREKTIRNKLSKLKKQQYIRVSGSVIKTTEEGKKYYAKRQARLQIFDSPFAKGAPKKLILMFDVPESRKAKREWLRRQLGIFGYTMIQKSVWVGPSPLPAEFKSYLKRIGLAEHVKTFRLARSYTLGK